MPPARPVDPEQHARDLGAAAADQAGEADDLAGPDREGDVPEGAGAGERLDREDDGAGLAGGSRIHVAERPADHQLDGPVVRHLLDRRGRDEQPVAQDRDPVGDAVDLLHAMADEHHRHALGPQPLDHLEQAVDLAPGQRRGGLVHDEDARLGGERPGDLDELLLGAAQPPQRLVGAGGEADQGQQALRLPAHAGPVQAAERAAAPALRLHPPDEDVLGDAEVGEETRMLVHDGDAVTARVQRRAQLHGPAVDAGPRPRPAGGRRP